MIKHSFKRGFTLIELLVVIAIIGVLSTIVLTAINTARLKSRDTNRLEELKQIQVALELYHTTNGRYPISNGPYNGWINECDQSTFLIPELISGKYITKISDVISCNIDHWGYTYGSNGRDYKLVSHTEHALRQLFPFLDPAEDGGPDLCALDGPGADPSSPPGDWNRHFGVWSSGATCWVDTVTNVNP